MLSHVEHASQPHTHPKWCEDDIPAGDGLLHISADHAVAANHVTVERCDGHPAAVRLEGDHEPMTPVEAFALGCTLLVGAVTAFADGNR